MEQSSHVVVDAIFLLMTRRFTLFVKDALFGFFVFVKDFVLKEIHERHVFSILKIFFNSPTCFWMFIVFIFTTWMEIFVTQFASQLSFLEVYLNECYTHFFIKSFIHVIFITFFWFSRILEEKTVITMATFVNVTEIISFKFVKCGLEHIFSTLLVRIF